MSLQSLSSKATLEYQNKYYEKYLEHILVWLQLTFGLLMLKRNLAKNTETTIKCNKATNKPSFPF